MILKSVKGGGLQYFHGNYEFQSLMVPVPATLWGVSLWGCLCHCGGVLLPLCGGVSLPTLRGCLCHSVGGVSLPTLWGVSLWGCPSATLWGCLCLLCGVSLCGGVLLPLCGGAYSATLWGCLSAYSAGVSLPLCGGVSLPTLPTLWGVSLWGCPSATLWGCLLCLLPLCGGVSLPTLRACLWHSVGVSLCLLCGGVSATLWGCLSAYSAYSVGCLSVGVSFCHSVGVPTLPSATLWGCLSAYSAGVSLALCGGVSLPTLRACLWHSVGVSFCLLYLLCLLWVNYTTGGGVCVCVGWGGGGGGGDHSVDRRRRLPSPPTISAYSPPPVSVRRLRPVSPLAVSVRRGVCTEFDSGGWAQSLARYCHPSTW